MNANHADEDTAKNVTFQHDSVRHKILGSYWLIVLLALPLWWTTTSIQRLSLPTNKVENQRWKKVALHVPLSLKFQNFSADTNLIHLGDDLQLSLLRRMDEVNLGGTFDIQFVNQSYHSTGGVARSPSNGYVVIVDAAASESRVYGRTLLYGAASTRLSEPELLQSIARVVTDLLACKHMGGDSDNRDHKIMQYAPRYRVSFSLLNEDATAGGAAFGWDIEGAIASHLTPTLKQLSVLHNFTIESQVQFHAPLAFTPQALIDQNGFGVTPEQLTIFINSAEWILSSSVSNDPVIHFILFIPSASRRPLRLLDAQGNPSPLHSFIVPQWGGITIYNPPPSHTQHFKLDSSSLPDLMSTFRTQLLALLGVPLLPPDVITSETLMTEWQLDSLLRMRTMETAKGSIEAMSSIVKLVKEIEGMPVGKDVRDDIEDALDALDKVYSSETGQSPSVALHYTSKAFTLASRAFFNPGMLAMLYFPAEHKLAVYTPLFAPMAVPLVVPVLREVKAWFAARQAAGRAHAG